MCKLIALSHDVKGSGTYIVNVLVTGPLVLFEIWIKVSVVIGSYGSGEGTDCVVKSSGSKVSEVSR